MANGLSIWEEQQLINLANKFIDQVKTAIYNKPIDRYTKRMGSFAAPVNASGRLAASAQYEFTDSAIEVSVYSYIYFLIYGRKPSVKLPPQQRIEEWIKVKGFSANPFAVMVSIAQNGTSIWQRHKGQDSGLLSDIDIEMDLQKLNEALSQKYVSQIADEISKTFVNLNLKAA